MSLAGLKKQINKANQYMSEKIGGAEHTKLDEDFVEMERKTDATKAAVEDVMIRTTEYLQPNPGNASTVKSVSEAAPLRGQAKNTRYPQPESVLGDSMLKFGKELGDDSNFGLALLDSGEAMKQLGEVKDSLDYNVKQNFLDPMEHLKSKEIREILHHRKKLESRRLDFDCKKRKQTKGSNVSEDEIRQAAEKFEESKELAESGMQNLLESDVEQVSQLLALTEAQVEYHEQSLTILKELAVQLQDRVNDANSRPKTERKPKKVTEGIYDNFDSADSGYITSPSPGTGAVKSACAKALYDFDPENEGELGFEEGDMITLTNRIDENWLEGTVRGKSGYFPTNYVEIVVDL
uniref:Endophilin-A2-like n=1 Tax=Saccoglossus kowalevskii TaxID=10224 RepID=A0ABM0LVC2_SACKO|nr:PREDICTED: endophilin-A2-like [Saccoglossus kowalevskii]